MLLNTSCSSERVTFEDAYILTNISTVDPIDGLKKNQNLVIKEGKISKIFTTGELQLSNANEIYDGTGKYLIPGLWDAHVHFAYLEEMAPSMFNLFLAHGVTSVRDTGGRLEFVHHWRDLAKERPQTAPRVKISGPLLDGTPNVYDGSDTGHPELSVGLDSDKTISKQLQRLDSANVDFLKAYEMLEPHQFGQITEFAEKNGLKLTGHVPLSMHVIEASDAGLNSMEHMRNLELSCARNWEELLQMRQALLENGDGVTGADLRSTIHVLQRPIAIENYDEKRADEVVAVLAKNDTWQIPTLTLNTGRTERHFEQPGWQESFEYVPDTIKNRWIQNIESLSEIETPPFQEEYSRWMFNMVSKINQADIEIMAGTDCPIFFLTPGYSLHQELAMLVKAGLSPQEALKTATYNPAKYFEMEQELGSIKENMWADLVLLDANPLEDIANTKKIYAVVKQGNFMDRNELDQLLEENKSEQLAPHTQ